MVLPDTSLKGLTWVCSQRAERSERRTGDRILETPCLVLVFRLEETRETCILAVDDGILVSLPQVLPVRAPRDVLVVHITLAEPLGKTRQTEIVIRVFECTGDAARIGPETDGVEIKVWDIIVCLPALKSTSSLE